MILLSNRYYQDLQKKNWPYSIIRDVIYEQKLAAAAGELNASIIARELNLVYNSEIAYKADLALLEPKREGTIIGWDNYEVPV